MITRKELEDFSRLKGLSLGNTEKDYVIDLALLSISHHTKNELIFKGGTCLYKFHKLPRFSEDLDFSAVASIDINRLILDILSDFERFGIKAINHQKKEPFNSVLITIALEGPLFTRSPRTAAHLGIDINRQSAVYLEPEILSYHSLYPDVPQIQVVCMKQEEIFAEKIRALLTRHRARDLFDLHFLLEQGISVDRELITKKMNFYKKTFDIGEVISKVKALENYWIKELRGFTPALPDFTTVHKNVVERLKQLYQER